MTDADKPIPKPPLAPLTIDDIQIIKPKLGGTKIVVTVRCPIKEMSQARDAIRVLASVELKNYVYDNRGSLGLDEFGIEKFGSHRPYTGKASVAGDRVDNDILGYEQDFRFTRRA